MDNTTAVSYLLKEEITNCNALNGLVRNILLKCHKNGLMVCPEYLRDVANLLAGVEHRKPSQPKVIQALGYSNSASVCKQSDIQVAPMFQPESLRQESIWGRFLEREVAKGTWECLPISKHHPDGPVQASKVGRGPDHDHTLLAKLGLVPRDHAPSNGHQESSDHPSGSYGMQHTGKQLRRS